MNNQNPTQTAKKEIFEISSFIDDFSMSHVSLISNIRGIIINQSISRSYVENVKRFLENGDSIFMSKLNARLISC